MSDQERYEIKGKLGEGGRGSVYEAYDRQLNRRVAIKRLHPGKGMDAEEAYQEILKESHALSALNSPNIVRVYDVAHDEDGPYVVMEYLDGKTLHEVVARAPLVEADFFSIAEQALEALVAAHKANLLHRDIKPANLVLTWLPSGRIMLKLLDFGLAKFATAPAVQTVAHDSSVLGSIYFMAPEQFDRRPLDERTDLYALGCVLYFALTGGFPFHGENAAEVMAAHLGGHCTDLKDERPDLPQELCDWVMHFLARAPDDRPSSAQEALSSLEGLRKASLTRSSGAPTPTGPLPVATGPMTATGPVSTATGPTGQVLPAATRPLPTAAVPTNLPSAGGLSKSFYAWVAVLSVLILVLAVAVVVRLNASDPAPPPEPGAEPPVAADPAAEEKRPLTAEERRLQAEFEALRTGQPVKTPPAPSLDIPRRLMKQRDKNKDGELTFNEYLPTFDQKLRKAERERFDGFDTDESGTLNLQEVRTKGNGMAQFLVRDKDGDIRLNEAEWLQFRPANGKQQATATFKQKDTNKDGFLSLPEYRAPSKKPAGKKPATPPKKPAKPGGEKPPPKKAP